MKQTTKALRALSPKRAHHRPRPPSDEESDGPSPAGGSPSFLGLQSQAVSSRTRQRTRRRRSSATRELPELNRSEEDFFRDWGITTDREEVLLSEFRREIEDAVGPLDPMFDRFYLRRFLRARQHDLGRAKDMFLAHLRWRQQNGVDTILQDFHFQERDAFLSLYPQGYHKTDKLGRPIYIQHIGAIKIKALQEITTEDRMIKFHIQEYERCLKYIFPSCSKKAGRHIDQTFAIMDVKGVGLKHLTGDVKAILSRITETDQNNYPETLGKTVIINAPTVFKMIWAMVRPMLDIRTQAKIEVAPSDYMKVLLKHVDADNIPEYLGGNSKGSLIDDVGPWKDPDILAAVEADITRRQHSDRASMDLDQAASSSPLSPSVSAVPENIIPGEGEAQTLRSQPISPGSNNSKRGLASFTQPQSSGTTDGEANEFLDARSRRQSILSTSGSSAYLSADDDFSDFYTPKPAARDLQVAGFSFHSDLPLLPQMGSSSLEPVAVVEASLPPLSQQQQVAPHSEQQFPSMPQGAREAAVGMQPSQRRQRPPLTVALPACSSSTDEQSNGAVATEVTLNGDMTRMAAFGTPTSAAWSPGKHQQQQNTGVPSPPLQIPILARVRALEEKVPLAEQHFRRDLPPGTDPCKAVGQGTLLHRVEALERAMAALMQAQEAALEHQQQSVSQAQGGCSNCCTIQ